MGITASQPRSSNLLQVTGSSEQYAKTKKPFFTKYSDVLIVSLESGNNVS